MAEDGSRADSDAELHARSSLLERCGVASVADEIGRESLWQEERHEEIGSVDVGSAESFED